MPPASVSSRTTVRTIDDVFSVIDTELPEDASMSTAKDFVRKLTGTNKALRDLSIKELESLPVYLSHVLSNTSAFINLMLKCKAVLGGPQATSYFYPICGPTECPWDFYCHAKFGDAFVDGFRQMSGADMIEDVKHGSVRLVHFRNSVNGMRDTSKIRIYISDEEPLASIFNLRSSYEQSFLSASTAVCFWPKLQSRDVYRVFESNSGQKAYPVGKTFYSIQLKSLRQTSTKRPLQAPAVYTGLETRVEYVPLDNNSKCDSRLFAKEISAMENIMYAVFNDSTRYLGSTGNMK